MVKSGIVFLIIIIPIGCFKKTVTTLGIKGYGDPGVPTTVNCFNTSKASSAITLTLPDSISSYSLNSFNKDTGVKHLPNNYIWPNYIR